MEIFSKTTFFLFFIGKEKEIWQPWKQKRGGNLDVCRRNVVWTFSYNIISMHKGIITQQKWFLCKKISTKGEKDLLLQVESWGSECFSTFTIQFTFTKYHVLNFIIWYDLSYNLYSTYKTITKVKKCLGIQKEVKKTKGFPHWLLT